MNTDKTDEKRRPRAAIKTQMDNDQRVAALQKAIDLGVASADAGELDIEAIKREARQAYAKPDAAGPR